MGHAEPIVAETAAAAGNQAYLRAMRASELCRMVRINEEIKKVLAISNEVNLTALNAKFMAHKSGGKAIGFSVVSTELRQFSMKLDHHMEALEELVFGMISKAAYVGKQSRLLAHLDSAMRRCRNPRHQQRIEALLQPKEAELEKVRFTIRREYIHFRMEVARALKLGRMGATIAQRAKVEAVYGSELATSLTQVSGQVENAVDRTLGILKNIRTHLGG
jgi:hypothetical protein